MAFQGLSERPKPCAPELLEKVVGPPGWVVVVSPCPLPSSETSELAGAAPRWSFPSHGFPALTRECRSVFLPVPSSGIKAHSTKPLPVNRYHNVVLISSLTRNNCSLSFLNSCPRERFPVESRACPSGWVLSPRHRSGAGRGARIEKQGGKKA